MMFPILWTSDEIITKGGIQFLNYYASIRFYNAFIDDFKKSGVEPPTAEKLLPVEYCERIEKNFPEKARKKLEELINTDLQKDKLYDKIYDFYDKNFHQKGKKGDYNFLLLIPGICGDKTHRWVYEELESVGIRLANKFSSFSFDEEGKNNLKEIINTSSQKARTEEEKKNKLAQHISDLTICRDLITFSNNDLNEFFINLEYIQEYTIDPLLTEQEVVEQFDKLINMLGISYDDINLEDDKAKKIFAGNAIKKFIKDKTTASDKQLPIVVNVTQVNNESNEENEKEGTFKILKRTAKKHLDSIKRNKVLNCCLIGVGIISLIFLIVNFGNEPARVIANVAKTFTSFISGNKSLASLGNIMGNPTLFFSEIAFGAVTAFGINNIGNSFKRDNDVKDDKNEKENDLNTRETKDDSIDYSDFDKPGETIQNDSSDQGDPDFISYDELTSLGTSFKK